MRANGNFQKVSIKKLNASTFNPPTRASEDATDVALRSLKESVEKHGILTPLLVTNNYQVGDGHRRLEVARRLGIPEVQIMVFSDKTPEELYQAQFSTRRPIGGEIGYVFIKKPSALQKSMVDKYTRLENVVGRKIMRRWCLYEGLAAGTIDILFRVYRYAHGIRKYQQAKYDPDFVTEMGDYMFNGKLVREFAFIITKRLGTSAQVRRVIEEQVPKPTENLVKLGLA